jgi:hypothetical protein
MPYTLRITLQVRGTRRILRTFIRPEFAHNTSSHATRFATLEEAETAADMHAERAREKGHTFIGADFYLVN